MSTNDSRILLANLYHDFIRLKTDYDSGFEELVNGFEITNEKCFENEWILELCSDQSVVLLNKFRYEWMKILQAKPYACIGVFMQLDEDWKRLAKGLLTKVIESINDDLLIHNWDIPENENAHRNSEINFYEILKVANHISRLAIATDQSINPYYQK